MQVIALHGMRAHTHTRFSGLPGWAGTRKVKPIWVLLNQETVSGSGISWTICKSAPRSRQTTMSAPHHSVFYRPDALPAAQPTASKHWRHGMRTLHKISCNCLACDAHIALQKKWSTGVWAILLDRWQTTHADWLAEWASGKITSVTAFASTPLLPCSYGQVLSPNWVSMLWWATCSADVTYFNDFLSD